MDELRIRRERSISPPRYQAAAKADKSDTAAPAQKTVKREAATVSETMRQLMSRVSQAERQVSAGRSRLQGGEASLAEVRGLLERMESLAREAAGGGAADRGELQSLLERLRGEIERILESGVRAGLFEAGEAGDGPDAVADAVLEGLLASKGEARLPSWLLLGLSGGAPDRTALLAALGVDGGASGAEVLAALGRLSPDDSAAAGYLASLYLGALIAGAEPAGPAQAAEGLRQLLELVAKGTAPDAAIELLTGGAFESLMDFQTQFTGGTAPGLDLFLMDLLLSGEALPAAPSLLALLEGDGGGLDLLMDLLSALDSAESGLLDTLGGGEAQENAADAAGTAQPMETREAGNVQAAGRDLSGARWDAKAGEWTVEGSERVIFRALEPGRGAPSLRLSGEDPAATLQQVRIPLMIAEGPQARLRSAGESVISQLRLGEETVLTLDGGGLLRIGAVRGGAAAVLRLQSGAVELAMGKGGTVPAQIVMDGPASLLVPAGTVVRDARGETLEPFDLLWKALLPDWRAVTALAVDGRQAQLHLRAGGPAEQLRLWLWRGSESQGFPAHAVVLWGRDEAGHLRTQYAYVRWDQRRASFQPVEMYPNPFTVTGGEADVDWRYEEPQQTLRILTDQVRAVSGGPGTDANERPFSGRLALADGIGAVELTLSGVACRVESGRAFRLGKRNDVTLLLQRGTENIFESGAGFAGISVGEGTSLRIEQTGGWEAPDGVLTATGGAGGAGIGRDSGAGRGKAGPILIRGGVITAVGAGGGAGIGGALGAAAGDIRIQGGRVRAEAACCAAAIGAGIQGACGDISITGAARVTKTRGSIGGCLFGNCGKVQVAAGTELSGARLWTARGLSVQVGEATVTLPRFQLSARALRLDGLDLTTRETARAALAVLAADRRWITGIQGAYGAMYGQLGQSLSGLYSVRQYITVVRDAAEAGAVLLDVREVLRQSPSAAFLSRRDMENVGQLLR